MNYSELSIKELKVIAASLDCTLQGDKRRKQSWIDAIEVAQAIVTLGEPETEAEFDAISSEYMGLTEVLSEIVCGNDDDTNVDDSTEPDGSDPDSGDIFGGFGDDEPWDSSDICGETAPDDNEPDVSVIAQRENRPKAKAISVFALLFCLIGFLIHTTVLAICITLKYTILIVMMFGRWNPNLDIWYQLTTLSVERKTAIAIHHKPATA